MRLSLKLLTRKAVYKVYTLYSTLLSDNLASLFGRRVVHSPPNPATACNVVVRGILQRCSSAFRPLL